MPAKVQEIKRAGNFATKNPECMYYLQKPKDIAGLPYCGIGHVSHLRNYWDNTSGYDFRNLHLELFYIFAF